MADAIRAFRPDVMHVHNFFPLLSPSIFDAARDAGVPSVLTLHNFRILCPTCFLYHDERIRERSLTQPCWWTVPKRVYRNSLIGTFALALMVETHKKCGTWMHKVDRFIAINEFAKTKFVEGGIPSDLIVVKPNRVACQHEFTAEQIRHGALFVGRLSLEKGIIELINAWGDVNYPLTVAGDGPLREKLEQMAAGSNVRFLGRIARDELYTEMRQASFLIMPSLWFEMTSLVVVEGFSNSLPALSADLGGMTETINQNFNGMIYRANDIASLIETVRWAIDHPEDMLRMGANARLSYEKNWKQSDNLSLLLRIYDDAIKERLRAHFL